MRATRRRGSLIALLTLLGLATTGVASAFWVGSGNGTGSATTGTAQTVTLSPATPTAQLYPGGQATVALSIANPNPGSVRVGSLSLDTSQGTGGFAVDGAHAACGVTSLGLASQTNDGAGWTVPGAGSLTVTLAGALSMSADAPNACQGAGFTVYLLAGP